MPSLSFFVTLCWMCVQTRVSLQSSSLSVVSPLSWKPCHSGHGPGILSATLGQAWLMFSSYPFDVFDVQMPFTLLQLNRRSLSWCFALIVKLSFSHGSVLDSVPTRSVITFHWVGVRTLMTVEMSSIKMGAYVLLYWGNTGCRYWPFLISCFSHHWLDILFCVLNRHDWWCWASLKHHYTVSSPVKKIYPKRHE